MPSRRDFDEARNAARSCLMASSYLLAIARQAVPDTTKAARIAEWLDHLARVLNGAQAAVCRVGDELTAAALATGVVRAGGMVRASAHRLAVDMAEELAMAISSIAPGLVPRGLSLLDPLPQPLAVPAELVRQHLPAIVASLAHPPEFHAPYVLALVEQERMRAIAQLESQRTEAAADQQARPPEGEPAGPANPLQPEKAADPIGETIRLLKRCSKQARILRYLCNCTGREALIETIAKDLYNARDATLYDALPTVRRQVERTRDSLDAKKAPLRLIISASCVQLVHATPGE
jgi:hypothetical protein